MLGLPQFYESLSTVEATLPLDAISSVSNQVWRVTSVLLGVLIATLFKPSAQDNLLFWFLISVSMVQAVMGMVCSTIVIVFSVGHHGHDHLSADAATLHYLCWTAWELFSFPAVCTAWSTITFIVALIVDTVHPIPTMNNTAGQVTQFTAAKVVLLLVISFAALRFAFFVLHVRRVSNVLDRATAEV
ncbi:hypothetical protein APHAL10511_008645 [Amanita phalloides]|nr:hypothetical protein APHAL10511_008645 [Amanita phalloides]